METHPTRVAVITGGGSGIGQAVVEALDARGEWQIHVFDVKFQDQTQTSSVHLHRVDICDYKELAAAFRSAFLAGGERLDFVFANAGILERENWYALTPSPDEPPPEPDWAAVEINLKGCMNTVRIARHYMAKSPDKGSILATSSSGGILLRTWAEGRNGTNATPKAQTKPAGERQTGTAVQRTNIPDTGMVEKGQIAGTNQDQEIILLTKQI
ncbi:hypothetical protein SCUP515_01976 [Seiridium cupressi]